MKKLVIGVLAHVDAGKTTLSESLLYLSGKIRKLGRVDNKDAYLDNYDLERERGITIFSKQALLEMDGLQITLLDTPGHVDFSTEMERTLQVLDYAILVINGADGVQAHTKTLWSLLEIYRIPVFVFINKMDQAWRSKEKLLLGLKKQLDGRCMDFIRYNPDNDASTGSDTDFYEQLALCDDRLMELYIETGRLPLFQVKKTIRERKIFPCFFGSALKMEGVGEFFKGIVEYSIIPSYPAVFSAKVFKISRDEQGNRLTHMKITGGRLKVKDVIAGGEWEEKVNQIRIYSGEKYDAVQEAEAGTICAVTGLSKTKPGKILGTVMETGNSENLVLNPVLNYQIVLPDNCDPRAVLPKFREIEEEHPELNIKWDEGMQEIRVQVMGEVQLEILQSIVEKRFGLKISFDSGRITYKETIANTVEGVGHFEPLGHYAEVHLLLEPGERGSGLIFASECSEDELGRNWQNLILTHLKEKSHRGVLTGSEITDMKITLVSGRAHNKHTEGGDFREATYRAVRHGLKSAESVLLEPCYSFQLELPEKMVGRAMTDIEQMKGVCQIASIENGMAVLTGSAPVATMRNYQKEVAIYTKGEGRLFCRLKGYEPCHNAEEVIKMIGYDSEKDIENPTSSVFCARGAGFIVPWDKVKEYMHIESYFEKNKSSGEKYDNKIKSPQDAKKEKDLWIDPEEVDKILNQAHFANKKKKIMRRRKKVLTAGNSASEKRPNFKIKVKEKCLLVDAYNIIFAWPDLKELAEDNMDGAKAKLIDYLSKYQSIKGCLIIAVFDAYRVKGHREEKINCDNVQVVHTSESQTADQYIEKFVYKNREKYNITVATSDNLQQSIVMGLGSTVLSAKEFKREIDRANEEFTEKYINEIIGD